MVSADTSTAEGSRGYESRLRSQQAAETRDRVVRAAAESRIPLVAAVGHETDWTLIDHAADRRAPTPTGAAEMVVPVRAEAPGR